MFTYSQNMHPLGFSPRENTTTPFTANSDLALGRTAYQGNYDGFRIIDISSPANPREILDYWDCGRNQGDVVVWDNILVRSWNSPASVGATCDGERRPAGVFGAWRACTSSTSAIRDLDLVASIETECGSHTASGVRSRQRAAADLQQPVEQPARGSTSSRPLDDPADASYLRFEPSGRSCHDTGVILGDAMMAACAGGNGFTV